MLTLTVPSGSRYVATVRSIATSLLDSLEVDPGDVYDISLILGEACANVVRHAYSSRRETYLVRLDLIPGGIAITVTDHGRGFDPSRVRAPDPLRPHGWGIWLIGQISDRVEVRPVSPHGTEVYVEKTLHFLDRSAALDAAALERAEGSGTRDAGYPMRDAEYGMRA
jgi:serine/threonine-protein kinase RsbW